MMGEFVLSVFLFASNGSIESYNQVFDSAQHCNETLSKFKENFNKLDEQFEKDHELPFSYTLSCSRK